MNEILPVNGRAVRTMQPVVVCSVIAVTILAACAAGCAHEDFARGRLEMRGKHMAEVADAVVSSGQRSSASFGRTADRCVETLSIDVRRAPRNLRALDGYVRGDFERFGPRLSEYGRRVGSVLRGRPNAIGRNAIILFY
jgi:hypothetical protein